MKQIKYIFCTGALFISLFAVNRLSGQTNAVVNTPASLEVIKAKSLWINSSNGAGLVLDKISDFTELYAGYSFNSGDYKLNRTGKDENILGVSAEGGKNLENAFAWGKFSFKNISQNGTLYNTQTVDFDRVMPYVVADPNLSDWKNQEYKLEMAVSSKPLWDCLLVGIKGEYVNKVGAKQMDPRSEVYYYHIRLQPGAVYTWGNNSLGANVLYENLNQRSKTTNSDTQVNQDVYVLKGLGYSYDAVVGGLQSLGMFIYKGNKLGGAMQYQHNFPFMTLFAEGRYHFRVEDVISTPTKPKKQGSVRENNYAADLSLLFGKSDLARVDLSYLNQSTSGIEYVQVLDNSYNVQKWIVVFSSVRSTFDVQELNARFSFFKNAKRDYKWKAGAEIKYRNNDDLYIMPESVEKVENLFYGVNASYNLPISGRWSVLAGADIQLKSNLNGRYEYNGPEPETDLINACMIPDFEFMKSEYTKIGARVNVVAKLAKSAVSITGRIDYYKPSEGSNDRIDAQIGLGFTF